MPEDFAYVAKHMFKTLVFLKYTIHIAVNKLIFDQLKIATQKSNCYSATSKIQRKSQKKDPN